LSAATVTMSLSTGALVMVTVIMGRKYKSSGECPEPLPVWSLPN